MNNHYHFQFQPYQRQFKQPLRTSHGMWRIREGIIITLEDDSTGKVGRGEIAPLPWFGSEIMLEAIQFCQQQGDAISREKILSIPDNLTACQFAFESALLALDGQLPTIKEESLNYCYLLPTGTQVLTSDALQNNRDKTTFKWKIGVDEVTTEIAILEQLIPLLPANAKLRLDANGGLTLSQAHQWLEFTSKIDRIEFIEQPLPPSQFSDLIELEKIYQTPLALDESVANIQQLKDCYHRGWRGIFVVKLAIAGFPSRLKKFCQQKDLDLVFSSVFETSIGRKAALQIASELSNSSRALGFGVELWLD